MSSLSPCIRQCTLDDEEYCLGCGRHLQEIVAWSAMTVEEQLAVRKQGAERCDERNLKMRNEFQLQARGKSCER